MLYFVRSSSAVTSYCTSVSLSYHHVLASVREVSETRLRYVHRGWLGLKPFTVEATCTYLFAKNSQCSRSNNDRGLSVSGKNVGAKLAGALGPLLYQRRQAFAAHPGHVPEEVRLRGYPTSANKFTSKHGISLFICFSTTFSTPYYLCLRLISDTTTYPLILQCLRRIRIITSNLTSDISTIVRLKRVAYNSLYKDIRGLERYVKSYL